jgi:hypothetical protein
VHIHLSRSSVLVLALSALLPVNVTALGSGVKSAAQKPSAPTLRWAESAAGCTFSRDDDGKYRYSVWTQDYGVILAVDAQELDKVRHRVEPFFAVHLTVRYRGSQTLAVNPARATLEFVKHFKLIQTALDPETFAAKTQDDADELEYQTEREVRKHPERKEEREKYVQTHQKEALEFLDFLTQRTMPATHLDASHPEISGWILFSTQNKWLGEWKKPEEFLLRFPLADRTVEFPFLLPAHQGDLILRKRGQ